MEIFLYSIFLSFLHTCTETSLRLRLHLCFFTAACVYMGPGWNHYHFPFTPHRNLLLAIWQGKGMTPSFFYLLREVCAVTPHILTTVNYEIKKPLVGIVWHQMLRTTNQCNFTSVKPSSSLCLIAYLSYSAKFWPPEPSPWSLDLITEHFHTLAV